MTESKPDSASFEALCRELLMKGMRVRFQARGASMSPCIQNGQVVHVTPVIVNKLRKGDIVLTKGHSGFRVHRLVVIDHSKNLFITRGDCGEQNDPPVRGDQILGVVVAKEVRLGKKLVRTELKGIGGKLLCGAARGQYAVVKLLKSVLRSRSAAKAGTSLGILVLFLSAASLLNAQVTFDRTGNLAGNSYCTGSGTCSFTWQHQVGAASSNYILVVTASLNIKNSPSSSVSGITYNGTALTFRGAHNDTQSIMRTEIWTLLAPTTGANKNIVMVVTNPAAATIGVMAGSASFSGVDQTVPVGRYVANDGGNNANTGYSMLDVPSVVKGMVVDALATGGQTITIPAPENSIYTQQSNNQTSATNVYGAAAYEAGAPSVPMAETFTINGGQIPNWSESAISLNPSQADIGVSTTVTPVAPGTNSVYNVTVYNNGPSAAAAVKLVDTLGTGTTYVSYTASAGVSCTDAGATLTCTVGALAPNATATVALTVSTTAAGFYPNTAVVSDSGTPPDYNQGNNTYVAVAPVQTVVCATNNLTVGGALSGVINTYYPGSATVAEGATSIPVGTATGAGATIASGTELLVMQMQNASIDDANSSAYGNGFTGQGFTAVNTAGNYEFVQATGPISGGSIPIRGAGPGGGLIFAYTSAAWSASAGASTYQVVVVPQYSSATLSSGLTALAWNGSTGGILAMDVAGTLTLGSATVVMDGKGFRGAAGLSLVGENGALDTDYEFAAPATYTTPALNNLAITTGADGSKGEGIAGTPLWIQNGATPSNTGSGYPSGTSGKDGSMGRGAPGNAGGGATDGAPSVAGQNNDNAGGGGGGNGGAGGFGGNSYGNNLSTGGEGGVAFPVTVNRFAMGGGGGGGSNNYYQDSQDSSGGAGGGMIFIRADSLSGSATLTANGIGAYTGTSSNAGGGGGAGGTIVVVTANGGETGLTLQANGGFGGGNEGCTACGTQTFLQGRIGPGAGGGGGAVYTSSVSGVPAISLTGGANGLTQDTTSTPIPYGATSGAAGVSVTNVALAQLTGLQSSALCTPDMTLAKNSSGIFTRGLTASYTIPVSNVSPDGPSNGTVTVNDTLPVGLTPINTTGTSAEWSCSIISQTVSCTNSTALAGAGTYPSIIINVNVLQTAPSTVTNTATVGGGGEINLANDTATNVASVISIADLGVTNAATPDPVAAGSNITYSQVLTNNGPSAADNATIVEAVPANTTFVSFTAPSGWNCVTPLAGATGNIVCTDLSMTGGTAATFSLIAKVNAAVANGTVITNTITASSSVADPNSLNNTASAFTVVGTTPTAEMVVTDSASPNPVVAGSYITYTQTSTNIGTGTANNPALTENTPNNTTFFSIAAPPGTTCTTPAVGATGAISCTAATAPAGSSGTVTLVVLVPAATASGTVINNTVNVTSTNQAFGTNTATASDIVATAVQADLVLTTAATPASVLAGNSISYTQTITNDGPATAANLSFTEAIPANTTFSSVSAPAGWACTVTATITCTASSLAANTSADIIVVVTVPATVTTSPISEAASVTSTTSDPNLLNNTNITTSTPVVDKCDLAVTNTGSPSPVLAGGTLTYTQTITNAGPSNCSTGTFREATPTNTTFASVAVVTTGGGTWTCPNAAPIACSNPSVPPGSVATLTAIYTVNAGTAAGTIITDTAIGQTTTSDTNIANNTAVSTIAVATAGEADLSITNSASPNPVNAGQNITYTQTILNAGPATASNLTVTETLPANTTFVSLSGSGWTCTATSPYTCTLASLAVNTSGTVTFVTKVNTTVASGTTIADTASVASTVTDPNLSNNSSSTSVVVADSADMSVTNTGTPVPVQAGNTITYTQVVTNAGPSVATTASLTETTPANTVFQSITNPGGWSCTTPTSGSAGTINCTNPSFASGSSSFTVVLKVNAGTAAGTAVNNTATVSSATSDPNSGNNTATANDVVALATQSDLVVTNSASPASVAAGSNITYTQSVTNLGTAIAATGATFTQTTPPNTNFQFMTPPAGWTCVTPAIGAAGTITCTASGTIAVNGTANFSLVLQVSASTPSGTNIAETAMATVSNIVPNLTTNSATASVIVANANSADMAIVKTATPANTVPEGDPLTYTLAVTNNGPATATNVIVTDPLPSDVTYLSSSSTLGTCSQADGTVTCQLGTMINTATATVTILTLAAAPGTAVNTATVAADQTDPNLTNNTSTQTEIITQATAIHLHSFAARTGTDKSGASRVILSWKTGAESHNLGFNIYREENGQRVRLNPSLIAGSALMMKEALPKHSGKTYSWIDSSSTAGSSPYWLEDVDVNGVRTMHGPVSVSAATTSAQSDPDSTPAAAPMFSQLNQSLPTSSDEASHSLEYVRHNFRPTSAQRQLQFQLAAQPAVKLYIKHEGWHRITQPELIAAGLDPTVDPAYLHLYAEAIEQPIQITGATAGPGGFGPQAALEFYGTGIDTPYTGTRVYFLVAGNTPGQRIQQLPPSNGSNQPPVSFYETVEVAPHTIYFSALLTTDGQNFFGPLISSTPTDQTITTPNFDATSTDPARVEVILQGVILGFPHNVAIALNGATLGNLTYTGEAKGTFQINLPPGVLQNGDNTVTFTAQGGEYDTSLLQSVRIQYPRHYTADSDRLKFTGRPGDELTVGGFTNAPSVVLDITDPNQPVALTPQIASDTTTTPAQYSLQVQVPWTTTNPSATRHILLAVSPDSFLSASGVRPNHPSHWHSAQPGSDIVMISHGDLASALSPLVQAHHAQGQSTSVVLIDDLYDEFTFGEHNPSAIRDFLSTATKVWQTAPHYLLLNGRASLDPRNYLGFGHLDFVPTKIVPSSTLMTASDDWFSDFNDNGIPTIATGRFPVTTPAEATLVASRVAAYEGQSTNGPWTAQALMVADVNDTINFTQASEIVQAQLPKTIQPTDVFASTMTIAQAQQEILSSINAGQLIVNYSGHGSEDEWSGDDLFNTTSATALTNGPSLPVFFIMNCLNGFFQDVYDTPLGVTLMLAPNGGAVAVLASSGLNQPNPQTLLNKIIVRSALHPPYPALGDAIIEGKTTITDPGVRKTFNLFGDPAMKIKKPQSSQQ